MKIKIINTFEENVKKLPDEAGVYRYFDKNGKILYIGKAKSLKKRVKSYFRFTPSFAPSHTNSPRINKMLSECENLEYILTQNELEALILENSLIKQLKPKYNILLRDDKTYPYICIDLSQEFPRFEITRKILPKGKIKYFGPYPSGAREILNAIYDLLPLVQRKGDLKNKKSCIFYQIGKCKAPCEGRISPLDYRKIVEDGIELINDKNKIIKQLTKQMEELSEKMLFEEAAALRDSISKIKDSSPQSCMDIARNEDYDIFAFASMPKKGTMVKIFVRGGKVISSSNIFINLDDDFDENEIYKSAIMDYYQNEIPFIPKTILLAKNIDDLSELEEFIKKQKGGAVKIENPQRGDKLKLVEVALKNANNSLKYTNTSQSIHKSKLEEENNFIKNSLKELFGLERIPNSIEAFDTSHLFGQNIVGAIVWWEDGFKGENYRKYNLEGGDEYLQMRELFRRRVESFWERPAADLWLIDGGAAQISIAQEEIARVGANIDVIAIAKEKYEGKVKRDKGAANDIIYYSKNSLKLSPSDKRLQFLQKIRDEIHRFAITFHRSQKLKSDKQSAILEAKGIGKGKLKKLLDYFGTFEAIYNANFEELCRVVDQKSANSILKQNDKILPDDNKFIL